MLLPRIRTWFMCQSTIPGLLTVTPSRHGPTGPMFRASGGAVLGSTLGSDFLSLHFLVLGGVGTLGARIGITTACFSIEAPTSLEVRRFGIGAVTTAAIADSMAKGTFAPIC